MTDSVTRIEFENENIRARISGMIDELRSRVSPGEVIDQVMDFARESGGGEFVGEFAKNLGDQVRANPLPCVLIGAGFAWLLMGDRLNKATRSAARGLTNVGADAMRLSTASRSARSTNATAPNASYGAAESTKSETQSKVRSVRGAADKITSVARNTAETIRGTVGTVAGTAAQVGQRASGVAASARRTADKVTDTAAGVVQRAAGVASQARKTATNVAGVAAEFGEQTADVALSIGRNAEDVMSDSIRSLMRVLEEQPLVSAALGIAIGAAIGASLPVTEAESRVMGEASESLRSRAREFAEEQAEKVKSVAAQTYEAAKEGAAEAAEKAGLTAQSDYAAGTLRAEHAQQDDSANTDNPTVGREAGQGHANR
jgi:hypothetical protein